MLRKFDKYKIGDYVRWYQLNKDGEVTQDQQGTVVEVSEGRPDNIVAELHTAYFDNTEDIKINLHRYETVIPTDGVFDEGTSFSRAVPHFWYVNLYSVGRNFGGPEEGGWWYDEGEPIASIPVHSEEDRKRVCNELHTAYVLPELEGKRHDRYSWHLGGEDLVLCVEDHFAAHYPTERPHYE